jgi:hypothetical protein
VTALSAPKRPTGRPPEIVPQGVAQALLEWLSGGQTLAAFCSQPGAPAIRTVYDWRAKDADFRQALEVAREIGWHALSDQCLEIADAVVPGDVDQGKEIARRRLAIKARLWLMSRWFPNRSVR